MRWFSTFEQGGMLLEILGLAYVFKELHEKYKPPSIYRTTKDIFEKDLVNLLEEEKRQKN